MAPPGRVRQPLARIGDRLFQQQPARARQRDIALLAQLERRPVDEFVDIAVVIGEQHEVLEIIDPGAGVMRQPGQAEIGAQPVEQRQRDIGIGGRQVDAVSQFIADHGEFGGREMPGQFLRADCAEP